MDSTEVFCPNDTCSGFAFPSFPYGVIGAVSGYLLGTAVVCGGAQTSYRNCRDQNTAKYCSRNAECVKSAGGSLWCTGPKTSTCYIFDRYASRAWVASPLGLRTARAYAASVVMPDGRLWVLGGADQSTILASTEFVEVIDNAIQSVMFGPSMPEPLISHCAALVSSSKVVVLGGFSSLLNDYTPTVRVYDFSINQWITTPSMTAGSRIDASCLNVEINGVRQALLAGGWSNLALMDSAVWCEFHQHFACSFHARSFQKCNKTLIT